GYSIGWNNAGIVRSWSERGHRKIGLVPARQRRSGRAAKVTVRRKLEGFLKGPQIRMPQYIKPERVRGSSISLGQHFYSNRWLDGPNGRQEVLRRCPDLQKGAIRRSVGREIHGHGAKIFAGFRALRSVQTRRRGYEF